MKYNDFLELREILESENFEFLFEDEKDQELNTQMGNWFTRWGRMKNKLNRSARKIQDQVINKVIQKYLPTILENERKTALQVLDLIQQKNQPKQIVTILNKNLGSIASIQRQQLKIINDAIDKFVDSSSHKMNDKIEASKMNDKNKLNIKNYWLLLTTQIKMNALQHMSTAIHNEVKNVSGNNYNKVIQYINSTEKTPKFIDDQIDNLEQNVEQRKQEVEASEKEAAAQSKQPEPQPQQPEKGTQPEISYKISKDYQESGPFTYDQLKQMASENKFDKDTYVWKQGMPEWKKAIEQPDLAPIFTPKSEGKRDVNFNQQQNPAA